MTVQEKKMIQNMNKLLTKRQAAEFLGCSVALLDKWIVQHSGPEYIKLNGKIVRYTKEALDAFVRTHQVRRQVSSLSGVAV
jgi:predicted DNA-binding transcriptional regulator AlpA